MIASGRVDADAVLILGKSSRGSRLTEGYAEGLERSCFWIEWGPRSADAAEDGVRAFMASLPPGVRLLIAGNRESVNPGIGEAVRQLLVSVWRSA